MLVCNNIDRMWSGGSPALLTTLVLLIPPDSHWRVVLTSPVWGPDGSRGHSWISVSIKVDNMEDSQEQFRYGSQPESAVVQGPRNLPRYLCTVLYEFQCLLTLPSVCPRTGTNREKAGAL